ncbi:uncharacterized protein [Leptinotarsa decemlineata]|uniref:uncharacterized protein n=1 Tax=Leptinotarsa decemlineata TaxID=7539 RepID=UPI003D309C0E
MEDKKRKQNREEEDGFEEDREKERANEKEIFNPKVILLRSPIKGSSQNERAANKQKIIEVAVKEAIGAMVESVQDSTTIEEDEEEATEVEVEKKRGHASLAFIRRKLDEIEEATSRQSGKSTIYEGGTIRGKTGHPGNRQRESKIERVQGEIFEENEEIRR